jgi:predicted nucleic acid-binding protein
MSARFFLDTNIFIYTFDDSSAQKKKIAQDLVFEGLHSGRGRISWQVAQEFLNVATTKFKKTISESDSREYLLKVLQPLCSTHSRMSLFCRALTIRTDTGFSFYDSLILAAALDSECTVLYSEDLQHNRIYENLEIRNPFVG